MTLRPHITASSADRDAGPGCMAPNPATGAAVASAAADTIPAPPPAGHSWEGGNYPREELRADGQLVAGADELRTCAKDPGGREQHAVQDGPGSIDGVETARRTGDEQRPTRAGNPVGRRGSEEGGPPTPSAAAKRTPLPCRLFTADGVEVFVTQVCTRCYRAKPLASFGLRRMRDGKIRSIAQCKACRSLTGPHARKGARAA